MSRKTVIMWVDEGFRRRFKRRAVDEGTTMAELSRRMGTNVDEMVGFRKCKPKRVRRDYGLSL